MFQTARTPVEDAEAGGLRVGDASVSIDRSGLYPIVVVTGRVTIDSTPRLRSVLIEVLRQSAPSVLVVDLSQVSHIDTSGFAVLIEVLTFAHEHSIRLRVIGINGQPRSLAELAQLDQIFTALESEVVFS